MRLAMQMTLDGLVRTLRATAHGLAEDIEAGYLGPVPEAIDDFTARDDERETVRMTGFDMRMARHDERGG